MKHKLGSSQAPTNLDLPLSSQPSTIPAASSSCHKQSSSQQRTLPPRATRASSTAARASSTNSRRGANYFNWTDEETERLVNVIYNNERFQIALLRGRVSNAKEKGHKTNKVVTCREVFKLVFPDEEVAKCGDHIKAKLRFLDKKYRKIKATLSQTGSGMLFRDMQSDHSDFANRAAILSYYPWFERWHKMALNRPDTGPVVLLTSSPYDSGPAPSASESDVQDMDEDVDDVFTQDRRIPALDAIAETSHDDPFTGRVLASSLSATFAQANPLANDASSSRPSASFDTPAPTSSPLRRTGSATLGADDNNDPNNGTARESAVSGSPTRNRSTSQARGKRDEITDFLRAFIEDHSESRLKIEEERTKREEERTKREELRLKYQEKERERVERMRAREHTFMLRVMAQSQAPPANDHTSINSMFGGLDELLQDQDANNLDQPFT
ncbi:uncharacterized protein UTRI_10394 [Ustilago trichophora]|uniref:Myb/SANT-like domain-containing protein n=1 Tax=Ustilago trichophora TaxID=86804 RepID=A0A5C3ECC0_9BASI|nr:uncharacterized protein UTRI_10394 [Ustilago trichophora]